MDTTIITTALLKISSVPPDGKPSHKLILMNPACLMITAKLSDLLGAKTVLLACNIVFLIFSMACGAAQTMNQL